MIDCKHATVDGRRITCGLGLHGGSPHIGVCMGCRANGGSIKIIPKDSNKPKKPCATKVCRMGDKVCEKYWSCRDTCRISNERITSMDKCPDDDL